VKDTLGRASVGHGTLSADATAERYGGGDEVVPPGKAKSPPARVT
jgi:hypothetical protein